MEHLTPERMEEWIGEYNVADLPVLSRTVEELAGLRDMEDRVTTQHVANVVLRDPIMTVKVLHYLQAHRSRSQVKEITTIAHALMMMGLAPFFAHFSELSTVVERLGPESLALEGLLRVAGRSRCAALYARDWARVRYDVDPEEIMIAALLHDLAEILLWGYAPELALEIRRRQKADRGLRSDAAQRAVLGFRLIDLQLALVRAWHLPELLHTLLDEQHSSNPRVQNVALAAALARHAANGWSDAALPDDYYALGRLLRIPSQAVRRRVLDVVQEHERDQGWYAVPDAPGQAAEQDGAGSAD